MRRSWKLIVTTVALAVLASCVAVQFGSSPAAYAHAAAPLAATDCYSYPQHWTCDGVDPAASGCATANASNSVYNVYQKNLWLGQQNLGVLQMRYSTHCKTNWTRFVPAYNYEDLHYVLLDVWGDYCYPQYSAQFYNVNNNVWTDMYYAPNEPVLSFGNVQEYSGGTQVTATFMNPGYHYSC
jgi:uncharacterized protein DUF2690